MFLPAAVSYVSERPSIIIGRECRFSRLGELPLSESLIRPRKCPLG